MSTKRKVPIHLSRAGISKSHKEEISVGTWGGRDSYEDREDSTTIKRGKETERAACTAHRKYRLESC